MEIHSNAQRDGHGEVHGQMQKKAMDGSMAARQEGFASAMVNRYLQIKDALVGDNSAEASSAAKVFNEQLDAMQTDELPAEKQDDVAGIFGTGPRSRGTDSGNGITKQREKFEHLSLDMIRLAGSTGTEIPLYEQYCPM